MYVYSSLVKDSIVGKVFAPIIRVVSLEDKPKGEKGIHSAPLLTFEIKLFQ